MKLLHTSDWHIGAMDGERSLMEDQRYFVDRICEIVSEQNIDAVIIAGDIYDRSNPSSEAIKLYDYAMTRLCMELDVQVLCIAGNHDGADRLSSCSELLSESGLHILGSLKAEPKIVSFEDTDVYFLPWITEEKVKSLYPEEKENISSLDDAYRVAVSHMEKTFVKNKRHILIAHAFITDSETSASDRAAEIGFAAQLPAGIFEPFDYTALGHLHKPQNVNDKIRYSGTPMPYSFGKEELHEKSVTVIDTETMTQTPVPVPVKHKRTTVKGTMDEIVSGTYSDDVRNGYVRIVVSDRYAGLETINELKRHFPNIFEISGKNFENDAASAITVTKEQLEKLQSDPIEIFKFFCTEELGEMPDEHLTGLFRDAVKTVEEEY